jgi:cell wall assembly regulator SMI1/Tfp pilus assembly protein PilE
MYLDHAACGLALLKVFLVVVVIGVAVTVGLYSYNRNRMNKRLNLAFANYRRSLEVLEQHPDNTEFRQRALEWGRYYSSLTRYAKGVTLYDEVAVANDISAACGGEAHAVNDENLMKDPWRQFEDWLSVHWPEGLAALNPPATDEEIASLEEALGTKLPRGFVDCLKIHNGQSESAGGLFDTSEFLSTGAILDQWKVWKGLLDSGDLDGLKSEPDEGIRRDWWNPLWIPFTHTGGGDHYCIDLAPDEGGQAGQVITMWQDIGGRELQAKSFEAWFQKYVSAVVTGEYTYSEDFDGLVPADNG